MFMPRIGIVTPWGRESATWMAIAAVASLRDHCDVSVATWRQRGVTPATLGYAGERDLVQLRSSSDYVRWGRQLQLVLWFGEEPAIKFYAAHPRLILVPTAEPKRTVEPFERVVAASLPLYNAWRGDSRCTYLLWSYGRPAAPRLRVESRPTVTVVADSGDTRETAALAQRLAASTRVRLLAYRGSSFPDAGVEIVRRPSLKTERLVFADTDLALIPRCGDDSGALADRVNDFGVPALIARSVVAGRLHGWRCREPDFARCASRLACGSQRLELPTNRQRWDQVKAGFDAYWVKISQSVT
jgi:hypothetical protein